MSRGPKWSEADIERMRQLFKTKKPTAEIASLLGRTERAVYVKAFHLGITKNPSHVIDISDQDKLWLRLNYPHMRTALCALRLGISQRTCIRLARRLNVWKTPEFMKESQALTAQRAKESHIKHGTYPPKGVVNANIAKGMAYRFQKGHKRLTKPANHG